MTMEFEHAGYLIDPTPLAEGGRYYARAKIRSSDGSSELKWSGDLGQFPSEAEAAERGRAWAIEWCGQHPAQR